MPVAPDLVDVWEELVRTCLWLGIAAFLAWKGRTHGLAGRPGWRLILAGFVVLGLGSLADLADEFPIDEPLLVAEPWGLLELASEAGAPVAGTVLVASGFLLWLPLPARLSQAELSLKEANARLARQVEATRDTAASRIEEVEQSLRLIAENSSDVVQRFDSGGRLVYVTPSVRRVLGYAPEELVGGTGMDVVHPDDARRLQERTLGQVHADGSHLAEVRVRRKDGQWAWLETVSRPVRDAQGRLTGHVSSSRDVTDRRRAEEALRASEERFRLAARATQDVLWDWDVPSGRLMWGGAIESAFGHRLADLAPTIGSWTAHVHPDDRDRVTRSLDEAFAGAADSWQAEYRFRRADGAWAHVLDRGLMVRGPGGQVLRMVGALTDLTGVKEAQERLEALERRHRELMDSLDEVFISTDLATGESYISAGAMGLFGRPAADFMADPTLWTRMLHPEDAPRVLADYARVLEGHAVRGESRIVRPDGSVRWSVSSIHPVLDARGRVARVEGILRDVTAEREAEQRRLQVEKLTEVARFKTDFLNHAAHELATPLTPIQIQLASLRRSVFGGLTPRQQEAIALLERNLSRLGLLVQDLLVAARLQGGKLQMARRPVDLGPMARDVVASFAEKAAQEGIALEGRGLEDGPAVLGDDARLSQVLFNLVHNAFKFTPRGGRIEVTLARDDGEAVLEVRDTGLGLAPEQMDRMFQPFSQVHDASRHNVGGTGLGLYISRGIVEQLGGTLSCRSGGPGKGSSFEIRLPLLALERRTVAGAAA